MLQGGLTIISLTFSVKAAVRNAVPFIFLITASTRLFVSRVGAPDKGHVVENLARNTD